MIIIKFQGHAVIMPYISQFYKTSFDPFLVTVGNYLPISCSNYSFPTDTSNFLPFAVFHSHLFYKFLHLSSSFFFTHIQLFYLFCFDLLFQVLSLSLRNAHASSEIICLCNYLEGEFLKRKDILFTGKMFSKYCFTLLKQSGLSNQRYFSFFSLKNLNFLRGRKTCYSSTLNHIHWDSWLRTLSIIFFINSVSKLVHKSFKCQV